MIKFAWPGEAFCGENFVSRLVSPSFQVEFAFEIN